MPSPRRWMPALTVLLCLLLAPAGAAKKKSLELEFLGEEILPTATFFDGTQVGGLSGIAYDKTRRLYYSLSDDQGTLQPVRYYTLRLDVEDGALEPGDVGFVDVTTLVGGDGLPLPAGSLDPEGIALTKGGELLITSEGFANRLVDPWIRRFELEGGQLGELPLPDAFRPNAAGTRGVRLNLGFESAVVTHDGRHFFTATEAALAQDGPAATTAAGSPARILRYDARREALERQYVYWTDPIAEPPVPATAFAVSGLVDLLPVDRDTLLAMERSFSVGVPGTGNTIKLYRVELAGATNVNGVESLAGMLHLVQPVEKTLLLDLDELGIPLDNVEGMTFGPRLSHGRRSLVLVSDNNFSALQFTQFLLFGLSRR